MATTDATTATGIIPTKRHPTAAPPLCVPDIVNIKDFVDRLGVPRELAGYALLNERQLAALLGCSVSLIQKQRIAGTGIPFVKIGSSCRYRVDQIITAIEAATFSSTSAIKEDK